MSAPASLPAEGPPRARTHRCGAVDRVALAAATVLGIGWFPYASGTLASLVTVPLAAALAATPLGLALAATLVSALCIWAGGAAEEHFAVRDPHTVVLDEVAGQLVTFVGHDATPATLGAGFLLFRLFDVWKPGPIRSLQSLPGGWGILLDDLAAGALANAVLWIGVLIARAAG